MSRPRNTKNVIRTCVKTISKRRNPPYCYIQHKYYTTCAYNVVYYMRCALLRVALKGFL